MGSDIGKINIAFINTYTVDEYIKSRRIIHHSYQSMVDNGTHRTMNVIGSDFSWKLAVGQFI